MFSSSAQPAELLTPSGQPETILTLDYGYMLASTNPKEPIFLFGRNGGSTTEELEIDSIPGLREFVATVMTPTLKAGGKLQIIHFEPHDLGREMKVVTALKAMNLRGFHLIQIVPVPLDMPLDREGQLTYDFAPFEAAYMSRTAVKH